MLTSAINTMR